jgi:hypothetical protein
MEDVMSEWQAIETAPKDGTWVLVVIAGYVPSVAHWDADHADWLTGLPEDVSDEMWQEFIEPEYKPTHWMPLPEAPRAGD